MIRWHSCRVKREHLFDGRRVNRWFLVDQNEQFHLAVQGEERDARDGHYIYSSRDPFASIKPMGTCTNQQQVMHWLENFITHHGPGGMHVGDHIRSVCTLSSVVCAALGCVWCRLGACVRCFHGLSEPYECTCTPV